MVTINRFKIVLIVQVLYIVECCTKESIYIPEIPPSSILETCICNIVNKHVGRIENMVVISTLNITGNDDTLIRCSQDVYKSATIVNDFTRFQGIIDTRNSVIIIHAFNTDIHNLITGKLLTGSLNPRAYFVIIIADGIITENQMKQIFDTMLGIKATSVIIEMNIQEMKLCFIHILYIRTGNVAMCITYIY